jgi:hypothetical protein
MSAPVQEERCAFVVRSDAIYNRFYGAVLGKQKANEVRVVLECIENFY